MSRRNQAPGAVHVGMAHIEPAADEVRRMRQDGADPKAVETLAFRRAPL